MSCFLLPNTPFLKLAFLPRYVIGYPTYQPTANVPATTLTAALSAARFTQQPLTVAAAGATNGAFCAPPPGLTPTTRPMAQCNGQRQLRPVFQGAIGRGNLHKQFRPGFFPKTIGKGVKRKSEEENESCGKVDSTVSELMQPLYCKICRVTLNAPAQAKQHYEGKNHARKAKLYLDGDSEDAESNSSSSTQDDKSQTTEKPSSTSNGSNSSSSSLSPTIKTAEVTPDVYCKICGVSFNSQKQATQHYQGKNHAKKLRATQAATNQVMPDSALNTKGSKYMCSSCNIHVTSQEQLDSHMKGARHAMKMKMDSKSSNALRGRWGQNKNTGSRYLAVTQAIGQFSPNPTTSYIYQSTSPPAKKPRRDFSMYRTPSGKYYCSACNLTLNSDQQMSQHVDSKKHKAANAARRNSQSSDGGTES